MPITFKKGDLFAEPTEALVNTVNCVGVMGKGVALEFKRRWPDNFARYKKACDRNELVPGILLVHDVGGLIPQDGPRYIVNFPTKAHWRAKSHVKYIEDGLDALVEALTEYSISSVALPPLGCGNGGLDWAEVKALIKEKLGAITDIEIVVLEPWSAEDEPEHQAPYFPMTFPRAVLLKALGDLEPIFDGAFDRLSLQKLVYLLQNLGVNFNLSFHRNIYGPYSDKLKQAFLALEKHDLVSGFSSDERLAHATQAAYAQADDYLMTHKLNDLAQKKIDQLSELIEGYEGPYGLELLSSVHHLAFFEGITSVEEVVESMESWSDDKRNKFSTKVIRGAYDRLMDDGLLSI
ncbi:macro domain-containing protein [Croceibacterium sp. LX-88]|uniref:Macro domain-containing protein n=1 Tax=Croceibacterium selenioxidans TaxID=2838833 RepID=A0ABS5W153_9SPHN|nr:macro domain-containing protein [Croceibacterium selenioxidans]MBT2133369.1 macro domain-containing protein [Croceibacterium selenioxidans]